MFVHQTNTVSFVRDTAEWHLALFSCGKRHLEMPSSNATYPSPHFQRVSTINLSIWPTSGQGAFSFTEHRNLRKSNHEGSCRVLPSDQLSGKTKCLHSSVFLHPGFGPEALYSFSWRESFPTSTFIHRSVYKWNQSAVNQEGTYFILSSSQTTNS